MHPSGYHSGGSFKLCFQVANTKHPNSRENITPLAILVGKDSRGDLRIALGMYHDQNTALDTYIWQTKKMRVLLFYSSF